MPEDLIPKEAPRQPIWLNILFFFSFIVFVCVMVVFFVVISVEKSYKNQLVQIQGEITALESDENKALEAEIVKYEKKINNFDIMAKDHLIVLNLFKFVQDRTLDLVWYPKFTLNTEKNEVKVSGVAKDFEVLGYQTLAFENQFPIKEMNLSTVSLDEKESGVKFELSLILKPEIFKNQ